MVYPKGITLKSSQKKDTIKPGPQIIKKKLFDYNDRTYGNIINKAQDQQLQRLQILHLSGTGHKISMCTMCQEIYILFNVGNYNRKLVTVKTN